MRRVLVIDDHQPSRRHLVAILNSRGYEIAGEGANSQNALALARTAAPDVILMAVGLPEVDGIETSRDVLQAHPLPIVLITSHYDSTTIERAKRAGVMGYLDLVKPLRPEELSPAIELAITRFKILPRSVRKFGFKEEFGGAKIHRGAKGLFNGRAKPVGRPGLHTDEEGQHEYA